MAIEVFNEANVESNLTPLTFEQKNGMNLVGAWKGAIWSIHSNILQGLLRSRPIPEFTFTRICRGIMPEYVLVFLALLDT